MKSAVRAISSCLFAFSLCLAASAAEKTVVAMNSLSASGELAAEADLIQEIMQAELSSSSSIALVDRKAMGEALKELQLGAQGVLEGDSVKKLGRIVGAKYYCGGSIRQSAGKTVAIVKVVDVETTVVKMAYASLDAKSDAAVLGKSLAGSVEKIVAEMSAEKPAPSAVQAKPVAIPEGLSRPVVMVVIPELHVARQALIDPAAETELVKAFLDAGFKVVDSDYAKAMQADPSNKSSLFRDRKTLADYAAKKGAEALIYGEAVSEAGATLDSFQGCRARVELKAVNLKTGEIILSDSDYAGACDLSEVVAGKKAIQEAARKLASKFLPALVEKWNNVKK